MTNQIAVIGRMEDLRATRFNEGDRISDLLRNANLNLSSSEIVTRNGNALELNDRAERDVSYFIVENHKSGSY